MDAYGHPVVIASAYRGVENDRHVIDIDAKPRRLTGRRHKIEDRYHLDSEVERDGIIDRYGRDANSRVFGTCIEVAFFLRAKLACGTALNGVWIPDDVGVADQAGRQLEVQFLVQRRSRRQEALLRVVFKLLGEVERSGQLKRVRASFFIAFKFFVFRREFVRFNPKSRSFIADGNRPSQFGLSGLRSATADRHHVRRRHFPCRNFKGRVVGRSHFDDHLGLFKRSEPSGCFARDRLDSRRAADANSLPF